MPVFWNRRALAITFLVLHMAGFLYAAVMFAVALALRLFLQLLLARTTFFGRFHLSWIIVPVGLAVVAALAVLELRRSLSRVRQGQPEPDAGLRARALACAVLACIVVNVVFLSTPETFAGPFRVRFPVNAWFSVAFAYGGYALWSVLLPWARRALSERVRRGLDLLVVNATLALVLAEIGVRGLAKVWPSPLLVTESSPSQIRRNANRQSDGTLWFGFPMNSGGHYDSEFMARSAAAKRIVSIGDSFSYGAVPHHYHFTTVAERELRDADVYNMGYSGIGPADYLYLLDHEALPLQPNLVVVNLFVGNDVTERPAPPGPSRWYDADSYLLAIVWYRLKAMAQADMSDLGRSAGSPAPGERDLTAEYPWLTNPKLEQPSVTKEIFIAAQARSAETICVPRDGLYPPFFETMEQIIRAAGPVPVAFVVIPEEYQVEDSIWQEVRTRASQPLDRDLAQRTIVAWLNARGLPVLDLLPVLRSVPPMDDGRRHVYHLHDMHFNARGNRVAGEAVARFADSLLSRSAQ